jgi:hypothetical protein
MDYGFFLKISSNYFIFNDSCLSLFPHIKVIKETGFLEDLYSEEELNSDNVKDRDAKTQFLDKLINVISKF